MTQIMDLVQRSRLDAMINGSITQHVYHRADRVQRTVRIEEVWRKAGNLGRGSFGEVYLEECVRGPKRGELRAVKRLHRYNIDVNRELFAIALLSDAKYEHCFVQSFGWYELGSDIYIAMEYLQNGHLGNCFKSALPEEQVQSITSQILEGVECMHDYRLAHRDLKPEGPLWWVKLADFGISKRVGEDKGGMHSQVGTASFVAPEVLLSSPETPYTIAVDLWSMGVITFLLLTGQTIFANDWTILEYAAGRIALPVDLMKEKGVSELGREFVRSLLQAQPDRRPTAREAKGHQWLQPAYDVGIGGQQDWYGLAEARTDSQDISDSIVYDEPDIASKRLSASKQWSFNEAPTSIYNAGSSRFAPQAQPMTSNWGQPGSLRYASAYRGMRPEAGLRSDPNTLTLQTASNFEPEVSGSEERPGVVLFSDELSHLADAQGRYGDSSAPWALASEVMGHSTVRKAVSNDTFNNRTVKVPPPLPARPSPRPSSSFSRKPVQSGSRSNFNAETTPASGPPKKSGYLQPSPDVPMVARPSDAEADQPDFDTSPTGFFGDLKTRLQRAIENDQDPPPQYELVTDSATAASGQTPFSLSDKRLISLGSDIDADERRPGSHVSSSSGDPNVRSTPLLSEPDNPFDNPEAPLPLHWRMVKDIPKVGTPQYGNVCFSPCGKSMAVTQIPYFEGKCYIYDTTSWNLRRTIGNVGDDVRFSPDGLLLAWFNGKKPEVNTWNISTEQYGHTFEAEVVLGEKTMGKYVDLGYQLPFSFSPDGKRLAVASKIGSLSIWDVPTGRRHCTAQPDTSGLQLTGWLRAASPGFFCTNTVTFSQSGRLIACGSRGYNVVVRSADTGIICHRLLGQTTCILELKFSDDDSHLLSRADKPGHNSVVLWHLSTGSASIKTVCAGNEHCLATPNDGSFFAVLQDKDGKSIVRRIDAAIAKPQHSLLTKKPQRPWLILLAARCW